MIHFLDASALVKRYVKEPGSPIVATLFRGRRALAVSRLSQAEVTAALARRARRGDVSDSLARAAATRFDGDLPQLTIVEVRTRVVQRAAQLVWSADLRAYDAVQLACALELAGQVGDPVTFVAADVASLTAAGAAGLKTLLAG